jgi:hypothetical protein
MYDRGDLADFDYWNGPDYRTLESDSLDLDADYHDEDDLYLDDDKDLEKFLDWENYDNQT